MQYESDTAIVLRVVEFSETSLITTLLSREHGKVRALAKGARRIKNAFDAALDVLCVCRIVFLPKASDSLSLLTEAKLVRRFRPQKDLRGLYAGYYVAELLDLFTDDQDPHVQLYDAAEATLASLAEDGYQTATLLRFECLALTTCGHKPLLDQCVACGEKVAMEGRVPFSAEEGGTLCARCRPGKRHVVGLRASTARVWETFLDLDSQDWQQTLPNGQAQQQGLGELQQVVQLVIRCLIGRSPRMLNFMRTHTQ